MSPPVRRWLCSLYVLGGLVAFGVRPVGAQLEGGLDPLPSPSPAGSRLVTLGEARRGFSTRLITKIHLGEPVPAPPAAVLDLIKYPSPAGNLSAYVSRPPADGRKRPAILWIFGGFTNGIGPTAWQPGDHSADAFREAGVVVMYPSLRGGNDNPGFIENFYGEVDDVLAAREWLSRQDFVDPARIYLGGHDTGGTLALLTAECSSVFRGVFAFGPVAGPRAYERARLCYDLNNGQETVLRAPYYWLAGITSPTFVFEGLDAPNRQPALEGLAKVNTNPEVRFHGVANVDHASILRPLTRLIAHKIADAGNPAKRVAFTEQEIADAVGESRGDR